jgi:hypothetical protein
MTAEIHVLSGPDKGKICRLGQYTVKIGVGATMDVPLNDMQLRGSLIVEWKNGVYHIRNNLDTAIWLGDQILEPGQSDVWYDERVLQPSAGTSLVLRHIDDAANSVQDRVVVVKSAEKHGNPLFAPASLTAGIAALLGLLFLGNSTTSRSVDRFAAASRYPALADSIQRTLVGGRKWAIDHGHQKEWEMMLDQFQKARLADRVDNRKDARERYQRCSRILQQLRTDPDYSNSGMDNWYDDLGRQRTDDALAWFLNQRLIQLSD